MSIGKVIEVSASSPKSFEDAIRKGIARATETVSDVRGAWVKEQQVRVDCVHTLSASPGAVLSGSGESSSSLLASSFCGRR